MNLRDKLKFWILLSNYVEMIVRGTSPLSLPDAIADSLSYVKAFGGTEQRNLPDNYIQRQFIYMMEGSYLLTDIVPQSDYRIELDFATTSFPSSGTSLFGTRPTNTAGSGIQLGLGTTGEFALDGLGARYKPTTLATINTRYKYVWNNKNVTLTSGSTTIGSYTFTGEQTQMYPFVLNGLNNVGTVGGGKAGIYLYSFKVWNAQGELIADYVPAIQKGTVPVVGFYDTVSGTFKTATAGTFAAGSEATPTPNKPMDIWCNNGVLKARHQSGLPLGYVLLDGITGDGTAYIDLDTTLDQNDDIEIEFLSSTAQTNRSIFGSRLSATSQNILLFYGGNSNQIAADFNNSSYSPYRLGSLPISTNVKYKAVLNKNIRAIYQGSTLVGSNTTVCPDTISINSVYLFYASGTPSASDKYMGTIYSVKIAGKRDLVPCKNANNEVGMYDFVSGQFFGNVAGSGAFIAGNQVSDPVEIYTDGTAEVLTDDAGNTASVANVLSCGDFKDTQEILSGAVTRNVGVRVLDGTENIGKSSVYAGSFFVRNVISDWGTLNNTQVYCSYFSGVTEDTDYAQNKCMILNNAFNMWWASDSTPTVAQFQQWLADQYANGTPVIVVYPLATATTESVAGQTLQVTDGDNVLEITQASLLNLELEAKYKKRK